MSSAPDAHTFHVSMEPETYTKRLLAIWLALPVTALEFWLASTRLPESVITIPSP